MTHFSNCHSWMHDFWPGHCDHLGKQCQNFKGSIKRTFRNGNSTKFSSFPPHSLGTFLVFFAVPFAKYPRHLTANEKVHSNQMLNPTNIPRQSWSHHSALQVQGHAFWKTGCRAQNPHILSVCIKLNAFRKGQSKARQQRNGLFSFNQSKSFRPLNNTDQYTSKDESSYFFVKVPCPIRNFLQLYSFSCFLLHTLLF